jgi:predicted NBD/HSP70 family sugar kinase
VSEAVGALDVGGTHVSAGRVDLAAAGVDPRSRIRIALPAAGDRAELLGRIVHAALSAASGGVSGLGVCAPGPFDYERGVCLISHKLEPLYGVNLRRELATALGLPDRAVVFLNDADAFLLGEWWVGAARGHERAVGVTLGTGLGSAFADRGRIVDSGARVPPSGSLHLLSFRGKPAEETISRRALIERYGRDELDVEQIAERARSGDERGRRAFDDLAAGLGELIEPWLSSFRATCLVVGGSIARAWDLLEPGLRAALAPVKGLEAITVAANLDDAALLGAARHAARGVRSDSSSLAPPDVPSSSSISGSDGGE